jgi:hypothetical protein
MIMSVTPFWVTGGDVRIWSNFSLDIMALTPFNKSSRLALSFGRSVNSDRPIVGMYVPVSVPGDDGSTTTVVFSEEV